MRRMTHNRIFRHGHTFLMVFFMTLGLTTGMAALKFSPVHAGQVVIAKLKVTHRAVSGQALPAPDEKGYVVGIGQREGEVDFDGKESARYESTAMVDGWIGKKVIYKGCSRNTFKDGSQIFFTWTAEGARNEEGFPLSRGQASFNDAQRMVNLSFVDNRVLKRFCHGSP
jgi:hypothetical protein